LYCNLVRFNAHQKVQIFDSFFKESVHKDVAFVS
jgi:hypothetical protein